MRSNWNKTPSKWAATSHPQKSFGRTSFNLRKRKESLLLFSQEDWNKVLNISKHKTQGLIYKKTYVFIYKENQRINSGIHEKAKESNNSPGNADKLHYAKKNNSLLLLLLCASMHLRSWEDRAQLCINNASFFKTVARYLTSITAEALLKDTKKVISPALPKLFCKCQCFVFKWTQEL